MRAAQVKEHEPANDRITARVPHSTRSIIERAAAIYGATINQFIVQAAVERANEVLQSAEAIKLSARDAKTFLNALQEFATAFNIKDDIAIQNVEESKVAYYICARTEKAIEELNHFYRRHHRARNVGPNDSDDIIEPYLKHD